MNINVEYLEAVREEKLLTIEQAAALVEISQTTWRKAVQTGEISVGVAKKLIKKLRLDKEKLVESEE